MKKKGRNWNHRSCLLKKKQTGKAFLLLFYISVCTDPMVDGPSGVFRPSGDATVSASGPDGYSTINFPASSSVILKTSTPAKLTAFYIRIGKTCSDGSPLKVSVSYFYLDMAVATVIILL